MRGKSRAERPVHRLKSGLRSVYSNRQLEPDTVKGKAIRGVQRRGISVQTQFVDLLFARRFAPAHWDLRNWTDCALASEWALINTSPTLGMPGPPHPTAHRPSNKCSLHVWSGEGGGRDAPHSELGPLPWRVGFTQFGLQWGCPPADATRQQQLELGLDGFARCASRRTSRM
jgi:hypothetical protein